LIHGSQINIDCIRACSLEIILPRFDAMSLWRTLFSNLHPRPNNDAFVFINSTYIEI
jgi:hypothetical protein